MNRWRSSVFFIWTRMYLYITVYSPLLFCVFFLLRLLVFLDSCKRRFFPFRSKKEKEREELFFAFLVLSFLVLSFRRLWKRQKKRELFFFFYYLTRTNKRTRMRRWDCKVRQEEESKKTTLDWRRCFSFFVVSFCVLVFDQDVVSFREEREKREPSKKQKRKEKSLSVQKIRFPPRQKKLFFFFLFQKRAAKERRGLQKNILDRVENFYHSIIIGQFKFQLAS